MPEVAALSVSIGADTTQLEAGLNRATSQVQGFGSQLASVGTAAGAALVGVGAAAAAGLGSAIKTAADFEKQISAIAAVSGEGEAGMERIRQTALQLGKDTSFSASEAAAGMEEIIKAGLSVEQVVGGAGRAVLDLSAASGTAVEESARIMSNALNTFKADNMTASDAANLLAGAANASATSVHELGFGLSSVGNVAATVGLDFKDTTTALALFAQNGLKGSDAGTSLKTMLLNLQPTTNKQIDMFRELGLMTTDTEAGYQNLVARGIQPTGKSYQELSQAIKTHLGLNADISKWSKEDVKAFNSMEMGVGLMSNAFFDAGGNIKDMAGIAEILKDKLGGMTKAQQISTLETMFGTDAIRAAAILTASGAKGVDEMTAAMVKQGDVQKIANERLDNFLGSWEKFTGSVETGAIILGSMFLPALKSMVDGMTEGVNQGIAIFEKLPDAWRTIGQVMEGSWEPSDVIDPFINEVGKAALALKVQFGPAIQAVSTFLTGTLAPAIETVGNFFAEHTEFIQGFVVALGSILGMAVVQAVLAGIATAIGLLLSPLALATAAITVLAAAWIGNWGGIRDAVMPIIEELWAIIQRVFAGDIPGALNQFLALLVTVGTQIAAQLLVWGQQFVAWIGPMIPPFLAAMADFAAKFFAWIASQVPVLTAALLLWGQQFVAWVAPQIPPLIAAATALGAALLAWIAAQLPPLIAQLLTWGLEFVAWVAPQIPPLLAELGKLSLAVVDWIIAQTPAIVAKLVEWGVLFGAWVATTAVPALLQALPSILLAMVQWIGDSVITISTKALEFGTAIVTGIFNGFTAAWATIGPRISEAIKSVFVMPSLNFGGGGGAQQLSFNPSSGGANPNVLRFSDLIAQAASEQRLNAADLAGIVDLESSGNPRAVSPSGALGLGQVMPFHFRAGEDPFDPLTNLRAAARVYRENLDKYGGDPVRAAAGYFGAGDNLNASDGSATGNDYIRIFQERRQRYQSTPMTPGGNDLRSMQRIPLSSGPGATPDQWPGFMQQTWEQLPEYLRSLDTIQQTGTQTFTTVGTTGVKEATAMQGGVTQQYDLMGTKSLGSVNQLGNATATTLRDAAGNTVVTVTSMTGEILNQYGTLANGASVNLQDLSTKSVASVNQMTGDITRTVTDGMGNVVQTVTTAGGQVIAQWITTAGQVTAANAGMDAQVVADTATTSAQVVATHADTGTKLLATTTDSLGLVTQKYLETSGAIVTIVTDQNGKTVADFVTSADAVAQTTDGLHTKLVSSTTDAMGRTVEIYTETNGEMVTIVTDSNGQILADYTTTNGVLVQNVGQTGTKLLASVKNSMGGVTETYQETTGEMVTVVTNASGQIVQQFTTVGKGATTMGKATTDAYQDMTNIPHIDLKDTVSQLGKATDAAKAYQKALVAAAKASEDLPGKFGGSKGGNSGLGKKAVGGPVDPYTAYLVGERGPELFMSGTGGTIIPNSRLSSDGGGGDIYVTVHVNTPMLSNERAIEEAVVQGVESAKRRGRL